MDAIDAVNLPRPRHHESARAVVQEGRVGRSQQRPDHGVVLVAGAGDRVVPRPLRLELAPSHVQSAGCHLIGEERDSVAGTKLHPGTYRLVRFQPSCGTGRLRDDTVEVLLDDHHAILCHSASVVGPTSRHATMQGMRWFVPLAVVALVACSGAPELAQPEASQDASPPAATAASDDVLAPTSEPTEPAKTATAKG